MSRYVGKAADLTLKPLNDGERRVDAVLECEGLIEIRQWGDECAMRALPRHDAQGLDSILTPIASAKTIADMCSPAAVPPFHVVLLRHLRPAISVIRSLE